MPHAKPWMSTLLDIPPRAAGASDQEVAQALLRAAEVVMWIHGAEDLIGGDLTIKRGDESREALLANHPEDVALVDTSADELRCS